MTQYGLTVFDGDTLASANQISRRRDLVLVIEDRPADAMLLAFALQTVRPGISIRFARNTNQAVQYLLGAGPYGDREAHPLPSLITLDLNLPPGNGFGFLGWRRGNPTAHSIPTVVITGSNATVSERAAVLMGASGCYTKTESLKDLTSLASNLLNTFAPLPLHSFSREATAMGA